MDAPCLFLPMAGEGVRLSILVSVTRVFRGRSVERDGFPLTAAGAEVRRGRGNIARLRESYPASPRVLCGGSGETCANREIATLRSQ